MTVWREEDLAAAHAGTKRLDRRDLLDGCYTAGNCQGYSTGPAWQKPSVDELKKLLAYMKPTVNLGRAYLVVPPEFKLPELQFVPFEEEQTESRMWRHSWGDYKFGMPVVRSSFPFLTKNCGDLMGSGGNEYSAKEEPVLPRLMAEHVELGQPKDLSVSQTLIFVVGVGTILCLIGGVL